MGWVWVSVIGADLVKTFFKRSLWWAASHVIGEILV
jgi:hypothetical protein